MIADHTVKVELVKQRFQEQQERRDLSFPEGHPGKVEMTIKENPLSPSPLDPSGVPTIAVECLRA